jgi:hypothetical protein
MAKPRPVGSVPLQAWAVMDAVRIVGGDDRVAVFWTLHGAKAFVQDCAHAGRPGHRVVRVVIVDAETHAVRADAQSTPIGAAGSPSGTGVRDDPAR